MTLLASRLRQRAEQLGLSNAEVARRAGLAEGRYAHYVLGRNEPNLAMLVRIAKVLGTTPNWLLGVEDEAAEPETDEARLRARLHAAVDSLPEHALELLLTQAEAVVTKAGTSRGE